MGHGEPEELESRVPEGKDLAFLCRELNERNAQYVIVVTLAAVRQIERYAGLVTKKSARITGYLIAPELDPRAEKAMEKSRHRLSFRALGIDIPTRIKVCRDCRRPYDERAARCPDDGSRVVI